MQGTRFIFSRAWGFLFVLLFSPMFIILRAFQIFLFLSFFLSFLLFIQFFTSLSTQVLFTQVLTVLILILAFFFHFIPKSL